MEVENCWWNMSVVKCLIEWEGTTWLGGEQTLTRLTEPEMPVYIIRILTWPTEPAMPVYIIIRILTWPTEAAIYWGKLMVTPTIEYRAICLWKMDTGQADICNFSFPPWRRSRRIQQSTGIKPHPVCFGKFLLCGGLRWLCGHNLPLRSTKPLLLC